MTPKEYNESVDRIKNEEARIKRFELLAAALRDIQSIRRKRPSGNIGELKKLQTVSFSVVGSEHEEFEVSLNVIRSALLPTDQQMHLTTAACFMALDSWFQRIETVIKDEMAAL